MFSTDIERAREALYEAIESELPEGTRIMYRRGGRAVAGEVVGHDITHVRVQGVTGAYYWIELDVIMCVLPEEEETEESAHVD